MEKLDYTALAKTYTIDFQIADSAATATALLAGHKTKFFTVGTSGDVTYGDCKSLNQGDRNQMESEKSESGSGNLSETIFMKSSRAAMATGLVTSTRITHATPAAAYAHSACRWWERHGYDGCPSMAMDIKKYSIIFFSKINS